MEKKKEKVLLALRLKKKKVNESYLFGHLIHKETSGWLCLQTAYIWQLNLDITLPSGVIVCLKRVMYEFSLNCSRGS